MSDAERREALPFDAKRKFFEKEIEYAQQVQTVLLPAKKTPEGTLTIRLSPSSAPFKAPYRPVTGYLRVSGQDRVESGFC